MRKRKILPVLVIIVAISTINQSFAAMDADKIRQTIQSTEIVPLDYRQHVNVSAAEDSVLISVYKDPDAEANDCKIDAILMAQKVLEVAPATRNVSVFFYDFASDDKLIQVDVPTSAVNSFVRGASTKAAVLKAAKLTTKQSNTLAMSYSGHSYKQIIEKLGVLEGPSQQLRALSLVRIDALASRGKDVSDLRRQYLHVEDLTRRGDQESMRKHLRELSIALSQYAEVDREARLESLRTEE